jgi:hypothetical protein
METVVYLAIYAPKRKNRREPVYGRPTASWKSVWKRPSLVLLSAFSARPLGLDPVVTQAIRSGPVRAGDHVHLCGRAELGPAQKCRQSIVWQS